ncbi:nitroreductase/quinone reductase family protein [Antrihabitans stalactiti]|uniref:Nitroreductase family deazaflavin-dependent oxidoreductase n=1 Tax=Antrihabitans stalactiti TaxID=2584121 RepID=A0A848KMK5_9NOCA|nr:nitroreductase/quinone reductase family protein [Antrihabitans stalactiti]NMN96977.1 nitroreductase family deazaflavin-dependent oxidoreductase [Antrihabitans stalactiti]
MTIIGRVNHLASTHLAGRARAFSRFHQRRKAQGKGKLLDRFFGAPTFLLTVRGRKSGELRSVPLMLTRRGDDIVVCGSNGGSAKPPPWYLNLRDAGKAAVNVDGAQWEVTARNAEGAERDECWKLLNQTYPHFATYQKLTERVLPVVVLERVPVQH